MDPSMLAMLMQQGTRQSQGAGLGQFFSGLFGNSGQPYEDYGREYEKYAKRGMEYQNPFYNAGKGAIGDYQSWLGGQKDPSQFINNLMGQYQQSPWAKFQMQQGQNTANNAASASGMLGSTPFMQASQDYSRNISSQDQNQWLQNVLGVNTQYGQGQQNLMTGGQNSANILTQLQQLLGQNMGEAAYGSRYGREQDKGNMIGGGLQFLFA